MREKEHIETCWACEEEFSWSWDDVVDYHETIEGQLVICDSVVCPHCLCSTVW